MSAQLLPAPTLLPARPQGAPLLALTPNTSPHHASTRTTHTLWYTPLGSYSRRDDRVFCLTCNADTVQEEASAAEARRGGAGGGGAAAAAAMAEGMQ